MSDYSAHSRRGRGDSHQRQLRETERHLRNVVRHVDSEVQHAAPFLLSALGHFAVPRRRRATQERRKRPVPVTAEFLSPRADVAGVRPISGADLAGVSPVPVQMWQG